MPKRRHLAPESVFARKHLEEWLVDTMGVKEVHRARIWKHYQGDIHAVPGIPRVVYNAFDENYVQCTSTVVDVKESEDGAKLLIELQDGHRIETVLIRHKSGTTRNTVCVSSQIGCQMACTFCATGTMGLLGNLTAAEILEQVYHVRERFGNVSNVVFMGLGEPLDNFDAVMEAVTSITLFFSIPYSRITVSTVGVVHAIRKLAAVAPDVQLAISLHAPNDKIRELIVPTARSYSVAKIMEAVAVYQKVHTKKRVMIEYICIQGINTDTACAHELGRLVQNTNSIVNLIPYNPTVAGDRYGYEAPSDEVLMEFQNILYEYRDDKQKPLRCTIRWSSRRGQSLDAACGQLVVEQNLRKGGTGGCSQETKTGDVEDLGREQTREITRKKERRRVKERKAIVPTKQPSNVNWLWVGAGGIVVVGTLAMLFRGPSRRP